MFIRALERKGSPKWLTTLRALSAVEQRVTRAKGSGGGGPARRPGRVEPPRAGQLGHAEPVVAEPMSDEAFDDGVSVLIEFAPPDGERHTLGIYIDHNLGGLVKDAFLAGPLDDV